MKLTEGTVSLHLGDDGVDKGEEIVLTLAHQHTLFHDSFCSSDDVHAALEGVETLALQVVDGSGLRGGFGMVG